MAGKLPFTPGATATIAASGASASGSIAVGANVIRLINAGPSVVFVRWGTGAQTAVTTDMPVLPGVTEVFSKPSTADTLAAITPAGGAATVYVTSGEGA